MNTDNIILTGMPGAGKSSIGVVLAKALGYGFVDTDLLIQAREHRLLREIIAREGVDRFLQIENEVNAQIEAERCVIAPGGSAVYGREAMRHFQKLGCIVYLRLSFEDLRSRLGDLKSRGVVLREGQTLWDLYEERTGLYERYADVVIDEKNNDIESTILTIRKELNI